MVRRTLLELRVLLVFFRSSCTMQMLNEEEGSHLLSLLVVFALLCLLVAIVFRYGEGENAHKQKQDETKERVEPGK